MSTGQAMLNMRGGRGDRVKDERGRQGVEGIACGKHER